MKKGRIKDILLGAVLTVMVISLAAPVFAASGSKTVDIWYDDISVVLDGDTLTLRDGSGKKVEPFTIDGTTYLPLRAIANALGLDVDWNANTSTVILESRSSTSTGSTTASGDYIGSEKAREIALDHADVSEKDAAFIRTELDYENGRYVYEVEFWSGNTEYDYEINATTGDIVSYDHDIENYSIPSNSSSGNYIGETRAKELVREKAGISGGTFIDFKFDYDDGRYVYEGELRDGYIEYEFEIDAVTGNFLEWSVDRD
jgi:uncharacterized membrane protein YkoI